MGEFLQFTAAIKNGDVTEVKATYLSDFVDMRDESGETSLHHACHYGNSEIVEYLIDKGWDIDCEDNDKVRPLHLSVRQRNIGITKILIGSGCLLYESKDSMNALLSTYKSNKEDKKLLPRLKSVNCKQFSLLKNTELSLLLDEIIAIFDQQYYLDIFEKIKNNIPLNDCENSKICCLMISANLLSELKINTSLSSLPPILIKYLGSLSDTPLSYIMVKKATQRFLTSLCAISEGTGIGYGEETTLTLWKYFNISSKDNFIKVRSAYLLALISISGGGETNTDCDMVAVINYMNDVIAKMQKTQSNTFGDFLIGEEQQNVIGEANTKIMRPSMTDYEKGDLLGRGSFGNVYKCYDPHKNIYFAMKNVLLTKNEETNDGVISLEKEIKIYSKWKFHKRIVRFFGTTRNDKEMNIFIEYMQNGSLRDKLDKTGLFPSNIVAKYSKQILEGLEFLHEKSIIHRDVKAANILVAENDNIKLVDFGISKSLQTMSTSKQNVPGSVVGTANWMAPELIRGEPYTSKVDVWSFGATVLELSTGKHPFHDCKHNTVLFKVGCNEPLQYNLAEPIAPGLESFLDQMFVHDPNKRADVITLLQCPFVKDL